MLIPVKDIITCIYNETQDHLQGLEAYEQKQITDITNTLSDYYFNHTATETLTEILNNLTSKCNYPSTCYCLALGIKKFIFLYPGFSRQLNPQLKKQDINVTSLIESFEQRQIIALELKNAFIHGPEISKNIVDPIVKTVIH